MAASLSLSSSTMNLGKDVAVSALNDNRPFFDLYPHWSDLHAVTYYMDHFSFKPGVTWFSSYWVLLIVPAYFLTLYLIKLYVAHVRHGRPYDLHQAVVSHNSNLAVSSGVLWLSICVEL